MKDQSWLDNQETALVHLRQASQQSLTEEEHLATINRIRAKSGDRPLTMSEFVEMGETVKRGIHLYDQYAPRGFIARLHGAVKRSLIVFQAGMRK